MTLKSIAIVHGAISIVNAVATGFGSALGISLTVKVELVAEKGKGITFESGTGNKMIKYIIKNVLPKDFTKEKHLKVVISSEIPISVGLKSSSAVSCAMALACMGLLGKRLPDKQILDSATNASLHAKTTITGAYDDSAACYYGGFVVTDNFGRKVLKRDYCAEDIVAIIYLPQKSRSGDISKLKLMADLYQDANDLAFSGEYWTAMNLNGVLGSSLLLEDYLPARLALENGALAASITGNGPALAAIANKQDINRIKSAFKSLPGNMIVSQINNEKAALVS
jgi:shikimate kinase